MFRIHLCVLLLASVTSLLNAQEPIRFARTPDISPDGKLVAFSYLGDIWTVEAIGGVARPVTMHEAHDIYPVFSPDGRSIAFSSNRFGSYDVFVVPTVGGRPKRLTFDGGGEFVVGWSPDGKSILFSSGSATAYPFNTEIHSIPVTGGAEKKLPFLEAKYAAISPDGKQAAFTRGPGDPLRRGYRGSSNDDIWLANLDGSNLRRLTTHPGQDLYPMWSPDGKKLYYVSDYLGVPANIVCQDLTVPGTESKPVPVTKHQDDGVRRARIAASGDWIVYECGADLWITSTKDAQPRRIAIEVHADEKTNPDRNVTYSRDISEYALSPDENHVAMILHGDIFLMGSRGGKATRVTETLAIEQGVSFSPDGKKLLCSSAPNGQQDLFLIEPDDVEHPELTKAHKFRMKQLTNTPETEAGASFSPDGTRIAFLRSNRLWFMKPDGSDPKMFISSPTVFDYDWSPDGKWIVYARSDGSFASEIYIVPTDGSQPSVNISKYATFNSDVNWAAEVPKISFISQRRGMSGMYVVDLHKAPAKSDAPAPKTSDPFDLDEIHLRANRVAGIAAQAGAISRNGKFVAFRSSGDSDDLWLASTDGNSVTRYTTGNTRPRQIRWSRNNNTIWFLDSLGSLRSSTVGNTLFAQTVNFTAKMVIRRDEEFMTMFEQCWRAMSENFYDQTFHGANWKSVREKYRALVPHVTMKEDFYSLISLMLGELNASHLGISGTMRNPEELTAELGLIFDDTFPGPGLKVKEILRRGPADKRGLALAVGDVLLKIDGTELTESVNLARLLNGKTGETLSVEVQRTLTDPKVRRTIELQAVSRGVINDLMYQRWVRNNAEIVSKLSGGKVGYIHIPSMDENGLEVFVRSLLSEQFDKEALLIDVRYNGGGFTHDQVLNYLGAKVHTTFRQRDGGEGLVLRNFDRKWTRPVAVAINNRSYSDAEIFPSAFRTLGLGKIIGQPTGGMVIGTNSMRLIDGSTFRLPRIGVFTAKGVNMEKEGVIPDIIVETLPEDVAKGTDPQLAKAVEILLQEIAAKKTPASVGR